MRFYNFFEHRNTLVENIVFKIKNAIIQNHQILPCYYKAEIDDQLDPQKIVEK
jgi:hypothetical protein